MPVPKELTSFFSGLVEKSRKSEINWCPTDEPDAYRVTFPDMAITVRQEGERRVRIELLNDRSIPAATICVEYGDEEWIGAVSLINSANRKVTKIDQTMQRAMEELGRDGPIGQDPRHT
jgi:hypothetical protein